MTPEGFAAKWQDSTATERAASQEHFIDLCRMLGVATPNEADPTGDWYAFEKGAIKSAGGDGFADVWKKGHFAWEYKGKRRDLGAAYQQLLGYREALENPPLLVVCDLNRFEVRTNFTNTATKVHTFTLEDLRTNPAEPLRVLRAVMSDPEELRPTSGSNELTIEAASLFAHLAVSLATRYDDPLRIAHFLDKLLFCLYAEDASVLPKGLVTRLIASAQTDPATFQERLADLFGRMASGGWFGVDKVDWFNGGLFADAEALELIKPEIAVLDAVSRLNWSLIEPAIFGTLFERGLDPNKRTQLGAHYTDRVSIERLVEPVVMTPLRREFEAAVVQAEALLAKGGPANRKKAMAVHQAFLERLRAVRVLDPACGSGNFLYIALRKMKDLEREAIGWASDRFKVPLELFVRVGPHNVLGLELNPYAAELARVTIWIGEIQWMINHGFAYDREPVLKPLEQITIKDALLDFGDPTKVPSPTRTNCGPSWPPRAFAASPSTTRRTRKRCAASARPCSTTTCARSVASASRPRRSSCRASAPSSSAPTSCVPLGRSRSASAPTRHSCPGRIDQPASSAEERVRMPVRAVRHAQRDRVDRAAQALGRDDAARVIGAAAVDDVSAADAVVGEL